jgi:probable addiction module antidote protein
MKITDFDSSDYLETDEDIIGYLSAILEKNDPDLFLYAIGQVAKAKGMTEVAQKTGLGRESLYKALAPGAKPRFETIYKVLDSLGIKLSVSI